MEPEATLQGGLITLSGSGFTSLIIISFREIILEAT